MNDKTLGRVGEDVQQENYCLSQVSKQDTCRVGILRIFSLSADWILLSQDRNTRETPLGLRQGYVVAPYQVLYALHPPRTVFWVTPLSLSYFLLCSYRSDTVPCIILPAPPITLQVRYHWAHSTDKEMEVQRDHAVCPRKCSKKWELWFETSYAWRQGPCDCSEGLVLQKLMRGDGLQVML